MTDSASDRAKHFRQMHGQGQFLVLANAWDAGSARLIESCGAKAIATTSAGLAWSRGYPDGDVLPPRVLSIAVSEIERVISVPLSVDIEGGYSSDPEKAAESVSAVIDAGAVGINLEDGAGSPDLLCKKIAAVKRAAARKGVDLFVNARTDVYLRGLVPKEQATETTIARAQQYREAGCDGIFVPLVAEPGAIREIASAAGLPLNVLVMATLPSPDELRKLGVRRLSAGSAIAQAVYGLAKTAATELFTSGSYAPMLDRSMDYTQMNALFSNIPAS
ncbi:MAG TPA: isocitrate lyase/phosphoenolpyruvate mutase family protein [Blastocatellia bacterium]|nr:isocitrate lyase/phosphoenolpyruvate mutase family protein [Blastocatellia bacterium]